MREIDSGIAAEIKVALQQRLTQEEFSSWTIDEVAEQLLEFSEAIYAKRVGMLKAIFRIDVPP